MLELPTRPTHVIGICGGAVAGSEAAALAAERGAIAIVFEQNDRPYGKIEDGLPRWHLALRKKEYEKIDQNLTKPGVLFVPRTRLGRDLSLGDLLGSMGLSALVLANGAWRDRPLPVPGIDAYVGKGLAYQNTFVYWFNHHLEHGYSGPRFDVPDGAIVIGGGLASIDVVKILNLETFGRAFAARGIATTMIEMEVKGIDHVLEKHGLTQEELGVKGCTLFYRRRKQDMPLASADELPPAMLAKIENARCKIMDKVIRKYLVKFEERNAPVAPIADGDHLGGIVFRRTEMQDGKLVEVAGSEHEVRAPMVVSSIGSVPEPIPGIPMKGELYRYKSFDTGEVDGLASVFGLGNVLTGKGNIKASRENAREVMDRLVAQYLGVEKRDATLDMLPDAATHQAQVNVERAVSEALSRPPAQPEAIARAIEVIEQRHREVGYDGYARWMERVRPKEAAI